MANPDLAVFLNYGLAAVFWLMPVSPPCSG
jgi:hypothetical protein